MVRPSASAASTEPPSESSTMVAPRTSLDLANVSNSRAVLSEITPVADIQVRHCWPHRSAGPSVRHSKRIGGGFLSSLATELSLANASRQATPSVVAPTRYRFTLTPLVPPVSY